MTEADICDFPDRMDRTVWPDFFSSSTSLVTNVNEFTAASYPSCYHCKRLTRRLSKSVLIEN
jgi:hypothetical protein